MQPSSYEIYVYLLRLNGYISRQLQAKALEITNANGASLQTWDIDTGVAPDFSAFPCNARVILLGAGEQSNSGYKYAGKSHDEFANLLLKDGNLQSRPVNDALVIPLFIIGTNASSFGFIVQLNDILHQQQLSVSAQFYVNANSFSRHDSLANFFQTPVTSPEFVHQTPIGSPELRHHHSPER